MFFSACCEHACQTLPLRSELTNNTVKTKMGNISFLSILNALIGITSYYCIFLKMVILHDAIKNNSERGFPFSLKKEQNLVSFLKKTKKQQYFFKTKTKTGGLHFFEIKNRFFSTLMKTEAKAGAML